MKKYIVAFLWNACLVYFIILALMLILEGVAWIVIELIMGGQTTFRMFYWYSLIPPCIVYGFYSAWLVYKESDDSKRTLDNMLAKDPRTDEQKVAEYVREQPATRISESIIRDKPPPKD